MLPGSGRDPTTPPGGMRTLGRKRGKGIRRAEPDRDPRLLRPYKDRLAKAAMGFCVGHTLGALGLPELGRVVADASPEGLVVRSITGDKLFAMESGRHVLLEQVSRRGAVDLYRVLAGVAAHIARLRGPVDAVIVYTGGVRRAADALDGGALSLRVFNVFAEDLDGDAVLERCRNKVEAGLTLDGEEAMALAFVGVMGHRERPVAAAVRDALELVVAVPREVDREACAAAIVFRGRGRLTEEELAGLKEAFAVAAPSMSRLLRAEGKAEGKADSIVRALGRHAVDLDQSLIARVRAERDMETLDAWLDLAYRCTSVEEFEREAFGRPRPRQ